MSGCILSRDHRPGALTLAVSTCTAMMQVEVLIGLVIGYPTMLWAVGGGWWGLIGMVVHLALLLKVQAT
jgi:hypothetical protein